MPLTKPHHLTDWPSTRSRIRYPRASSTFGLILWVVKLAVFKVQRTPMSRLICPIHTGFPWYLQRGQPEPQVISQIDRMTGFLESEVLWRPE